jgi:hypothetical protein
MEDDSTNFSGGMQDEESSSGINSGSTGQIDEDEGL